MLEHADADSCLGTHTTPRAIHGRGWRNVGRSEQAFFGKDRMEIHLKFVQGIAKWVYRTRLIRPDKTTLGRCVEPWLQSQLQDAACPELLRET